MSWIYVKPSARKHCGTLKDWSWEIKRLESRMASLQFASTPTTTSTTTSIFFQFMVAQTACLSASARWLLRRVRFFLSWVEVNYTLRLAQLNSSMAAYVTAAVEIIYPALIAMHVCVRAHVCWESSVLLLEATISDFTLNLQHLSDVPPPPTHTHTMYVTLSVKLLLLSLGGSRPSLSALC